MIRSCNDIQVFRGAWDQTFTAALPGLAPLPQDSLSTCLSIDNSRLSIELLVMSVQQPASGCSPDPWPRARTSRRGASRLQITDLPLVGRGILQDADQAQRPL